MIAKSNITKQAVIDVDTKTEPRFAFGNDASVDTKEFAPDPFGNDTTTIGFIRVRKRRLKGAHCDGSTLSMSFDLVRAVRVNGKPRHQFILGLGSQKQIAWCGDCDFWAKAIYRMTDWGGYSELQRRHLATKMIRKGARLPTIQQFEDRIEHWSRWPEWGTAMREMIAIIRATP